LWTELAPGYRFETPSCRSTFSTYLAAELFSYRIVDFIGVCRCLRLLILGWERDKFGAGRCSFIDRPSQIPKHEVVALTWLYIMRVEGRRFDIRSWSTIGRSARRYRRDVFMRSAILAVFKI
jgi:hypothetical protein